MGITDYFMRSIVQQATSSSTTDTVVPTHGLSGKAGNNALGLELTSALEVHFTTLCKSASSIYLPNSYSFRVCYQNFIEGRDHVCCYMTYVRMWKQKYPHLKTIKQQKKVEDENDVYGDITLGEDSGSTGGLEGGEDGGSINATADGSMGGGGGTMLDNPVDMDNDHYLGGGGVFVDADSVRGREEG